MKITAIICEFNPIHSGHVRLIRHAKDTSDFVVCIMSGNFTQRAMPAVADKYTRAKHAIISGADIVVELPTVFATSSAENFAYGGVKIAKLMHADTLLFGSECGNIEEISQCVERMEQEDVRMQIKQLLQQGYSYPKAIATAINSDVVNHPNNVLAMEYVRAINKLGGMVATTIKREDNYNGNAGEYASSSLLRADKTLRSKFMPHYAQDSVNDNVEADYKQFAVTAMSLISKETLMLTEGVSEGIENKFASADKHNGYDVMIEQVKSKRYTQLHLQRIVFNALCGITKDIASAMKDAPLTPNVLAVKIGAENLLQYTTTTCDVITSKADTLYNSLTGATIPDKIIKI